MPQTDAVLVIEELVEGEGETICLVGARALHPTSSRQTRHFGCYIPNAVNLLIVDHDSEVRKSHEPGDDGGGRWRKWSPPAVSAARLDEDFLATVNHRDAAAGKFIRIAVVGKPNWGIGSRRVIWPGR